MAFLATLEPQVSQMDPLFQIQYLYLFQVFLYILASISEGLQALGGNLNYFTGAVNKLTRVSRISFLSVFFCLPKLTFGLPFASLISTFIPVACSCVLFIFKFFFASIIHCFPPDTMVCTGCCATLDHIVTYLFKKVTNKGTMKWVLYMITGTCYSRQKVSQLWTGKPRQRLSGDRGQDEARDTPADAADCP